MRALTSFLRNPFDDDDISLDELLAFSSDSLERFIAKNTGGQWSARIAATAAALATLSDCSNNDQIKYGTRRAAKLAKDQFRAQLPANIAKLYGAVVAVFGPDSPQVLDCFPDGRTPFETSTDDALANLLSPLATKLTGLTAAIGTNPGNAAGSLLSVWLGLHAASETSTGQKSVTEAEKRLARKALQHQHFLNLLAVAEHLENQPERLGEFMQEALLKNSAAPVPPVTPPPTP